MTLSLSSPAMNRRRFLMGAGVMAAGISGAALIGCGAGDEPEEETANEAVGTPAGAGGTSAATVEATATAGPKHGGVLRIHSTSDIVLHTGYPFLSGPQNRILPWTVSEALVRYRSDVMEPELVLAERFEYSDDRTKLVVALKPDLTFHNGAPVTPEDVFFGIDFHLDPASAGVTMAGRTKKAQASAIVERQKLDARTMEFTFDQPRYDMTGFFVDLNVTHAGSYAELMEGKSIQGTGPYVFDEWTPNVGYTMTRNDSWHLTEQEGGPYLDGIDVAVFADNAAAATAFEAGELDVAFRLSGGEARQFRDQVTAAPRVGGLILTTVVTNPLLTDTRVRRAIFLALDRQRIADELTEGFYGPTAQIWPEFSPAYDPTLDAAFHDPEESKRLLAEAGFTQSEPLLLEYTPRSTKTAAVVQQNLAAVGIELELVPTETAALVKRIRGRELTDLYISGTNFSDPVPAAALASNLNVAPPNVAHYESEELLAILDGLSGADPHGTDAQALYERFNQLWLDDPWVMALEPSGALDAVASHVRGVGEYFVKPPQAPNFGAIWLDA